MSLYVPAALCLFRVVTKATGHPRPRIEFMSCTRGGAVGCLRFTRDKRQLLTLVAMKYGLDCSPVERNLKPVACVCM